MNLAERIRADLYPQGDGGKPSVTLPTSEFSVGAGTSAPARAAFEQELAKLDHAGRMDNGTLNYTLNSAAFSLGQLVAGGELTWAEVFGSLLKTATEHGHPHATAVKSIESGLTSGAKSPRSYATVEDDEPLSEDELDLFMAEFLTDEQLKNLPPPRPLIQDVLYADSIAWIIGEPGAAKSIFALDWANCVARGRKWKGKKVEQGKVLYIIGEGRAGINQRVEAWREANDEDMHPDVLYLPRPVQVLDKREWDLLTAAAKKIRPVLIVMDTQAQCTAGVDENTKVEMDAYIHGVQRMGYAAGGACVLSVHHVGNNGKIRGSTVVPGAATTIIKATRKEDEITLINRRDEGGKQKDAAPFDDMHFNLVEHELDCSRTSVTVEERIGIVL